MYRSEPLVATLVQERRNAALQAARSARLTRIARPANAPRYRWWRPRFEPAVNSWPDVTAPSAAPELALILAEIGAAVAELSPAGPAASALSRRLLAVVDSLESEGRSVGLEPLGSDASTVVACRWLGRLAERTAGHLVPLETERSTTIACHIEELRRLGAVQSPAPTASLPCAPSKAAGLSLAKA